MQATIERLQEDLASLKARQPEQLSLPQPRDLTAPADGAALKEQCARLQAEKRVLKAVCKLSLAVTTDHVSGQPVLLSAQWQRGNVAVAPAVQHS